MARGGVPASGFGAVLALASCGRYDFHDRPDAGDVVHGQVVTFGDLGDDSPRSIIVSADGNVIIGGQFRGTVDFGCSALTSAGGGDGFVLELTPALSCVRTWTIGSPGDDRVMDLAEDRAGNLLIVGEFRQTA